MGFSLLQKIGASLLIVAWILWGGNMIADFLVPVPEPLTASNDATPAAATAQPAEPAEPEVPVTTLLASASVEKGQVVFKKCRACHTNEKGAGHRVGPDLWDIVGRPKGGASGFSYSDGMASKGGDWTYEDLDRFLHKPKDFVPGTKMGFAGLKKAEDRAALIAYLRTLSDSPVPLP